MELTFRPDGTFTIVQLTDVHWMNGGEADGLSQRLIESVLDAEKPDLVAFTGDLIYTGAAEDGLPGCADPVRALREAVAPVEHREIPWACVFGNHDTENGITRRELMDAAQAHRGCVAEHGPRHLHGVGNYCLTVQDSAGRPAAALYFFDSGEYSPLARVDGYDWIRRDQIGWYEQMSREHAEAGGGEPLPALAFFHIPLPEYDDVWQREVCYGHRFEGVCCPRINSGLFTAMAELGDVMGTFAGHDHINDYWGELHGIRLCYGRATGYNTYGRDGFPRGARVIRLREGARSFETWLRLDDGSVVTAQPRHEPERAGR